MSNSITDLRHDGRPAGSVFVQLALAAAPVRRSASRRCARYAAHEHALHEKCLVLAGEIRVGALLFVRTSHAAARVRVSGKDGRLSKRSFLCTD